MRAGDYGTGEGMSGIVGGPPQYDSVVLDGNGEFIKAPRGGGPMPPAPEASRGAGSQAPAIDGVRADRVGRPVVGPG